MRLRKIKIFALSFLLAFAFFPPAARAEFSVDAKGAILMDADTGQILFEQNPDFKGYPASMTKIMTMLLALEAVHQGRVGLEDKVRASERAAGFGGTQVYLAPGEEFTLDKMLKGIAVGSANDASVAVAEFLAGSDEAFAEEMTKKAKELGATHTNFTNSHGLDDPNHYTTPRDMAIIARYSLRFPEMLKYTSIKQYEFREKPKQLILYNTNKTLWWYPGADGLKTGTTSQAGRNVTVTAQKEGLRLIGVVMMVDRPNGHFAEAMKLLNYGFSRFAFQQFYPSGGVVGLLPVGKGSADSVPVVAGQRVGAVLPKGSKEALTTRVEMPPLLQAPVEKGKKVGEIAVLKKGVEVARRDLLAGGSVGRGSLWREIKKVWLRSVLLPGTP